MRGSDTVGEKAAATVAVPRTARFPVASASATAGHMKVIRAGALAAALADSEA
jgi:hypothetical protein